MSQAVEAECQTEGTGDKGGMKGYAAADDGGDDSDDDGGGNDDNEDDLYIIRNMIGAACLSDLTPRCWLSIKFNGSITKFKRFNPNSKAKGLLVNDGDISGGKGEEGLAEFLARAALLVEEELEAVSCRWPIVTDDHHVIKIKGGFIVTNRVMIINRTEKTC